jgi:hypothetical protein
MDALAVRLLNSDSAEVLSCLAYSDCLCVRRPWSYLPFAVLGSLAIFFLTSILRASGWEYATRLGGALLIAFNGFLCWRAIFNTGNWIIAVRDDRLYFRLFAAFLSKSKSVEPSVMELDVVEIASISIRAVDAFYLGPKPHILEWLVVEPNENAKVQMAQHYGRVSPPANACDTHRQWFTGWQEKEQALSTRWFYKPPLRTFLELMPAPFAHLKIAEERRSELDLMQFSKKSREEQARLVAQAMRLGLRSACEHVLMYDGFVHRSRREARDYLATIDSMPETRPEQAN